MSKVFIDTDVGGNVDDAFALALAMNSPEVELLGVTTVHGDVARRSQVARRIIDEFGGSDVPVAAGESRTLGGEMPVGGVAQAAALRDDERKALVDPDGIDLLIDTVTASPGEVTLVTIGPLTNVATAIRRRPEFAEAVGRLVTMGSDPSGQTVEHNFSADPEAAAEVLRAGMATSLIGYDISSHCWLTVDRLDRLRASDLPGATFLGDVVRIWGASRADKTVMVQDPLAVACAAGLDVFSFEERAVRVETAGERAGSVELSAGSDARIATTIDADRFVDILMERLLGGAPGPS